MLERIGGGVLRIGAVPRPPAGARENDQHEDRGRPPRELRERPANWHAGECRRPSDSCHRSDAPSNATGSPSNRYTARAAQGLWLVVQQSLAEMARCALPAELHTVMISIARTTLRATETDTASGSRPAHLPRSSVRPRRRERPRQSAPRRRRSLATRPIHTSAMATQGRGNHTRRERPTNKCRAIGCCPPTTSMQTEQGQRSGWSRERAKHPGATIPALAPLGRSTPESQPARVAKRPVPA